MANPIIKIKRGNENRLYSNEFNITENNGDKYLQPLEDGELAYNAWNNGLYIGYNGTNYLLSVANENNKNFEPQTFYGTATNALIASSLGGKTVGSSSKPIYLSAGSPIECGDSLDVDISGNAATATTWQTARNFSISGTASDTTTYSVDGTKNITLTLPKTLSGFTSLSAATFTGGVWRCNNGSSSYDITHPETSGEVVVHTADTAQGSETLPVYIDENGVVTPCTASSVFSDFSSTAGASGETLSITVAGQTRTVTLDAANASQGGVITTGTQTIAGQKTFNGTIYSSTIAPRTDMNPNYTLGDTSNTWYNIYSRYLTLYDGTNGYNGGRIYTTVSADTTAQSTLVQIGNSTATGTAGNRYGILRLYSEGSTYLSLVAHRYATNSTSTAATSRTIYLRDHGNTAYLVATTTREAVGSGTKPVYVSTSGVITPSSSTLGATDTPIYMSSGELKACSSSKGSASVPVYMSSGKILQCTASSIFSSFTSSTNTLSITVCGETRTVKSVVKSVSNTWTDGTTAGPTLKTTVNGVAGTEVAIPSASSSASGIVTTGAQTFAGTKTFNEGIYSAKLATGNTGTANPSGTPIVGTLYFKQI